MTVNPGQGSRAKTKKSEKTEYEWRLLKANEVFSMESRSPILKNTSSSLENIITEKENAVEEFFHNKDKTTLKKCHLNESILMTNKKSLDKSTEKPNENYKSNRQRIRIVSTNDEIGNNVKNPSNDTGRVLSFKSYNPFTDQLEPEFTEKK